MTRGQVVFLHIAVALTAVTGLVFGAMKYLMTTDDPFAVANHPMQPHVLAAHVVAAPLLLFGLGWIFGNHIAPGIQNRTAKKRGTGLGAVAMIAPMVLSGYLMQIATGDAVRQAMVWLHWISSGLFLIAYAVHLIGKVQSPKRPED